MFFVVLLKHAFYRLFWGKIIFSLFAFYLLYLNFGTSKKYIDNVHVKDVKKTDTGNVFVPVGHGDIDWKGQMNDLKTDGYAGNIVIETHCKPLLELTRKSVEYVRNICNI